jgi:uncharacterized membrane protein
MKFYIYFPNGGNMMDQQFSPTEVTSDDRLWGLLSYLLTPIIPIVILLMPDKKDRPFLKAHTMQALLLGVVEFILESILGVVSAGILGCVVWVAAIVINVLYALKANKGEVFEIPVITNFIRQQGW